jgi:tRNA uridine 5-carbamoylmethylation protein Kti12
LACLIILRGPQCSGKTEVSQRLRERLDKKHKKQTYLLKLNEINTERFKKSLNEALDKRYKYVVGELNYGAHNTDPMIWLHRFKDKQYQIISFVLVGGKQVRLQRCRNDPKRSPFDIIDESFFNHDSESFERHEHDKIFYKKSGLRGITLNTENKSPSQLANEILRKVISLAETL